MNLSAKIISKVSGNERLVMALAFAISLITSLIVLSSRPFLQGTGDTSTYVSLSKEIMLNGLIIPRTNTIHYPGSVWVYPPIFPYMGALVISIARAQGWDQYMALALVGSLIFSLTSIPVYLLLREMYGNSVAILGATIYPFFLPSLYILSWGGYPQLLGFLLTSIIIYYVTKAERMGKNRTRYALYSGLVLGILALSHDLTFVLIFLSVIILIIYRLIIRVTAGTAGSRSIKVPLISVLISSVFGAYWYAPRIWWVKDSAFPTSSPEFLKYSVGIPSSPGIMQDLGYDIFSLQQPLGPISMFAIIFALYVVLLFFLIIKMRGELKHNGKIDFAYIIMLVALVLSLLEFKDPVLFVRLFYFVLFTGFIVAIKPLYYGVKELMKSSTRIGPYSREITVRRIAGYAVILLVLLNAVTGISFNYESHTFYGSDTGNASLDVQSMGLLNFVHKNLSGQAVIAAPVPLAFDIMGYAGNPVLAFQPSNYLTQPVEWAENYAAYIMIYNSSQNVSYTDSLIHEYNVSYVIIPAHTQGIDPSYSVVYISQYFILFRVP